MRNYNEKGELITVTCNQCKKKISIEQGIIKEGNFHGDVVFGYFSQKDGQHHTFDLCEECYDKLLAGFLIPADIVEETELM